MTFDRMTGGETGPAHGTSAVPESENVCIFCHFDRDSVVREYVFHYVKAIASAGFSVIFVSTANNVDTDDRRRLEAVGARVFTRENRGIDFGSWQYGLRKIEGGKNLRRLILANDSVFGPLFDLRHLIDQMEKSGADFWGVTDSYEKRWHLQSYFLCLNGNVVRSHEFQEFFRQDFRQLSKSQIIDIGETALSQLLLNAGFRGRAACPYNLLLKDGHVRILNPTHYYWDRLIERHRCPFLKVQLLRENPGGLTSVAHWRDVLSCETDYDIALIEDQLAAHGEAPPKRSSFLRIHRRVARIPYLLKLALLAATKALKHPARAVAGLEQFLVADLSMLPSHPGPTPTASYADQRDAESPQIARMTQSD